MLVVSMDCSLFLFTNFWEILGFVESENISFIEMG